MNFINYILITLMLSIPLNAFAGLIIVDGLVTDTSTRTNLAAYYDLRDRSSYVQVTLEADVGPCTIHVQIFQQDRGCDELNFFDTLTSNDTVVYDLDNLLRNNGSPVPANLADDSYGYVTVVSDCSNMIGNFRIIDDSGYEYRTNMSGQGRSYEPQLYANLNTLDDANQADIVGFAYDFSSEPQTFVNYDAGFDADIFIYDFDEEPLSCDTRNFACGNVMNYGVNEDYPNSKDGPLLCPGGGLADPQGGYIHFGNIRVPSGTPEPPDVIQGFIGINNGDGTGSMDTWYGTELNQ